MQLFLVRCLSHTFRWSQTIPDAMETLCLMILVSYRAWDWCPWMLGICFEYHITASQILLGKIDDIPKSFLVMWNLTGHQFAKACVTISSSKPSAWTSQTPAQGIPFPFRYRMTKTVQSSTLYDEDHSFNCFFKAQTCSSRLKPSTTVKFESNGKLSGTPYMLSHISEEQIWFSQSFVQILKIPLTPTMLTYVHRNLWNCSIS